MPAVLKMLKDEGSPSTRLKFLGAHRCRQETRLGKLWGLGNVDSPRCLPWHGNARYPILGDGKGDNQNTAVPFTRGTYVQCIDANQAGVLSNQWKMYGDL